MDVKNAHRLINFCYDWNYQMKHLDAKPIYAFGNCTYTKQDDPESWFCLFADMMRVAEDYGRYYIAGNILHNSLFGSKGSFWLIHEEIERKVGFDVNYNRSVVEDQISCVRFNNAGYPI